MVLQGSKRLLLKMTIKIKKSAMKGISKENVGKRERVRKTKLVFKRVKAKEKAKVIKIMRISINIFLINYKQH